MNVWTARSVTAMQLETKYLRLRTAAALGSQFGDWRVCWLGDFRELVVKSVGEPDAGNPHVRFDERGWETERCRMAQATAPILDSTDSENHSAPRYSSDL